MEKDKGKACDSGGSGKDARGQGGVRGWAVFANYVLKKKREFLREGEDVEYEIEP